MPIGDFDIINGAAELHMFCTGSSDRIGFKQAHDIYNHLMRRIKEWRPSILSTSRAYDSAVKKMISIAAADYYVWREDYIKQFNKHPEDQDCWQDEKDKVFIYNKK